MECPWSWLGCSKIITSHRTATPLFVDPLYVYRHRVPIHPVCIHDDGEQRVSSISSSVIRRNVGDLTFIAADRAALPPHDSEDDYLMEVTNADGREAKTADKSVSIPVQTHRLLGLFRWKRNGASSPWSRLGKRHSKSSSARSWPRDPAAQAIIPILMANTPFLDPYRL